MNGMYEALVGNVIGSDWVAFGSELVGREVVVFGCEMEGPRMMGVW